MKTRLALAAAAAIAAASLCSGCPPSGGDDDDEGQDIREPGDAYAATAGSVSFDMVYANDVAGATIPTGMYDDGSAVVPREFFIGRTEVTNALAAEVLQWAYDHARFSDDPDDPDGVSAAAAKHGGQLLFDLAHAYDRLSFASGTFSVDPTYEAFPAQCVRWYGAVMLCNWLTEMLDGGTANLVYSGIDDDWEFAETLEDASKDGYRLPTLDEWELAARYIDGSQWTYGDHASGDESGPCHWPYEEQILGGLPHSAVFGDYAWYMGNSGEQMRAVATRLPNHLGIFDMSGNAGEWCWIRDGSCHYRSGSAYGTVAAITVGSYTGTTLPADYTYRYMGIRLARTKN